MRILVVEDDRTLADFVSGGLRQAGYAVDVAGTGDDGLRMGLETSYDAAVVDLMLPGLDGLW
jgi:two-component system OmpR family response regulator